MTDQRPADVIRADLELARRRASAGGVMIPSWTVQRLEAELAAAVERELPAALRKPAHGGFPGEVR